MALYKWFYLLTYLFKILTHVFISSRLNCCNVLYCSMAKGLLSRLLSAQNATTRLVTGLGRWEHITPVLPQLHRLPVHQNVMFKLVTLVHRLLARTAQVYLSDECHLTSSVGMSLLHSAEFRTCVPHKSTQWLWQSSFFRCQS